jgi:hypothetical protein
MRFILKLRPFLAAACLAAVAYCGWTFLSRRWPRHARPVPATTFGSAALDRIYGGNDVQIVSFSTRDGVLTEGQSTVVCYGVVNAKTVRLEPASGATPPSLSRCLEVAPKANTRYTLTVTGHDGRVATASLEVQVQPDAASFPKITSFKVVGTRMVNGRPLYALYFTAENAETVSVEPPVVAPLRRPVYGHFSASPTEPTTYVITALGKKGRTDKRSLTLPPK